MDNRSDHEMIKYSRNKDEIQHQSHCATKGKSVYDELLESDPIEMQVEDQLSHLANQTKILCFDSKLKDEMLLGMKNHI